MLLANAKIKEACLSRRRRELHAIWPKESAELADKGAVHTVRPLSVRSTGWRKIVITAFSLLLIFLLMVYGNRSEVFAKAETWLKENVGEWKIVRVNRSGSEAAFASYEMRWIPDRFQHLVQEENSAFLYSVEYNNEQYIQEKGDTPAGWGIGENEVTDSLAWGYYKTSKIKKTEMAVGVFDTEDKHWNILEEGEWKINNQEVLYYVYLINTRTETEKIARESICCIWTDETNDVTFRLDGNLSRDEAMMIVRNIKKVK